MNRGARAAVLTCAKEKHADVVDGLSCRQLESGFGFVDLLQIRLQESSGYAATKHGSVSIRSDDKIICLIRSCSTGFLRPSSCGRVVVPGPALSPLRSSCCSDSSRSRHIASSLDFPSPLYSCPKPHGTVRLGGGGYTRVINVAQARTPSLRPTLVLQPQSYVFDPRPRYPTHCSSQ